MSKKCTPLWCEAHFQVNMLKTLGVRTTFGRSHVEKVHAVVARSTFRSQNVENTRGSDHFWTFRCRFAWQAQGMVHLVKSEQNWGFCSISKNDGRRGTFEEDLQRCIFRGRRSARDIFIGAVRRWGCWFPERGCILEHQIFRFAEMCVTGALRMTWHHFFVAGAVLSTGGLEKSQNALVRGCQICTQLSIFEGTLAELLCFWCCQVLELKKSRRIASFWMLSSSKNEEVSQNCFVFDVVNFAQWGSLAEELHFQACR